jgi:hypothetical protein
MTAAIHVCDSEEKGPDHVAGRFGSDDLETLAHLTIGRRSPRRMPTFSAISRLSVASSV